MNKNEIALKALLEGEGFYVDEIYENNKYFMIEGERIDSLNNIPFEVSVRKDVILSERTSFLDYIVNKIIDFENEVLEIAGDFIKPKESKLE